MRHESLGKELVQNEATHGHDIKINCVVNVVRQTQTQVIATSISNVNVKSSVFLNTRVP